MKKIMMAIAAILIACAGLWGLSHHLEKSSIGKNKHGTDRGTLGRFLCPAERGQGSRPPNSAPVPFQRTERRHP